MKTFILGILLGVSIVKIIDFVNDPPPPSNEAQIIINSMKDGQDWRLGRATNCIVNEKANTVISKGLFLVNVEVWETEKTLIRYRYFDYLDLWHITQYYNEARRKLEISKFK